MGLERVASVWQKFALPISCPVVAVAGTNGKGSSVSMLEAVYRNAGYKTGTYTSPHLVQYNERICIGGVAVDDETLLERFQKVEEMRTDTPLTYFEFGTVLALYCLVQAKVEVMILEVGLGGRLDATNIIDNDLALITSISVDHASWLGNDRETIGMEKAGIIKPNGVAVYAGQDRPQSIDDFAAFQGATLYAAGRDFSYQRNGEKFSCSIKNQQEIENLQTNLEGLHQIDNAAGVLMSVRLLSNQLPVSISEIRKGLMDVSILARQQWIQGKPSLLLDVSHNEGSIEQLVETLNKVQADSNNVIHAVFGALEDKNISAAIKKLLPRVNFWHLTSIEGERGQTAGQLQLALGGEKQFPAALYGDPVKAYKGALKYAVAEDIVLIFGSFHVVGDIIAHLH